MPEYHEPVGATSSAGMVLAWLVGLVLGLAAAGVGGAAAFLGLFGSFEHDATGGRAVAIVLVILWAAVAVVSIGLLLRRKQKREKQTNEPVNRVFRSFSSGFLLGLGIGAMIEGTCFTIMASG